MSWKFLIFCSSSPNWLGFFYFFYQADELTSLKEKHSKLTEEHASAIVKTERLEAAKEADAVALAQLRDSVTTQKAEIIDLYSQVAELESLKLKLASQNDLSADLRKQLQELEVKQISKKTQKSHNCYFWFWNPTNLGEIPYLFNKKDPVTCVN